MPYHRLESPTQTTLDAQQQAQSGEIWGTVHRPGGLFPSVKAYPNSIPVSTRGIEFSTPIPHDPNYSSPAEARWLHPHTTGVIFRQVGGIDYAVIPAVVTNYQP